VPDKSHQYFNLPGWKLFITLTPSFKGESLIKRNFTPVKLSGIDAESV